MVDNFYYFCIQSYDLKPKAPKKNTVQRVFLRKAKCLIL